MIKDVKITKTKYGNFELAITYNGWQWNGIGDSLTEEDIKFLIRKLRKELRKIKNKDDNSRI